MAEQNPRDVPVDGIAVTAIGVAVIRARETARTDRLYTDPLAQAFVDAARTGFSAQRWAQLTALADDFYEGRTVGVRLVDDRMREARDAGIRQIVLLGAGLDTRAFRMELPPDVRIFEVDLPETFAFKEPVLDRVAAVPTCARQVVVADLKEDWQTALIDAGFRIDLPTSWVDEGTFGNLKQPWSQRVVRTLTEMSAPGSLFGLGRYIVEADSPEYREYRRLVAGETGSSDAVSGPGAPDFDAEQWLEELGWTTEFRGWNDLVAPFKRDGVTADPRVGNIAAVRR